MAVGPACVVGGVVVVGGADFAKGGRTVGGDATTDEATRMEAIGVRFGRAGGLFG